LEPPVGQYKSSDSNKKADAAQRLTEWLRTQKELGLVLTGFVNSHTQVAAATLALDLIEELPDTHVEPHYDKYRLFFGKEHIDFSQAVALEYYFFTIIFGILRAGRRIKKDQRKLFVAMDRFPGKDTDSASPGTVMPLTDGEKFIDFIKAKSSTGIGITNEQSEIGIDSIMRHLQWWKLNEDDSLKKGKQHPHFILPDWLITSAIAKAFPDDFIATFSDQNEGKEAVKALSDLYGTFKSFDLYSLDKDSISHIKASDKLWEVPDEARTFIMDRASAHDENDL